MHAERFNMDDEDFVSETHPTPVEMRLVEANIIAMPTTLPIAFRTKPAIRLNADFMQTASLLKQMLIHNI